MFDGVPADQFHQLLASSLPTPLSFAVHHQNHLQNQSLSHGAVAPPPPPPHPPTTFPGGGFELYASHPHQMLQVVQHHQHIHPQLHHHSSPPPPPPPTDSGKSEPAPAAVAASPEDHHPWLNDEVLTLLRIRSGMENWFPEYTWEHVSRKLEEHGYRRSADKCKEKFEEESRHFNSNMGYNNKSYRFFGDLDEIYPHDGQDLGKQGAPPQHDEEREMNANAGTENAAAAITTTTTTTNNNNPSSSNQEEQAAGSKKRKREHEFEMLKGFCEAVVKRIVAQQEDLHNKLVQDIVRRDEESIAREQARKCLEIERINKEIETRAREQDIAWERQAKIIDLLKQFTANNSSGNSEEDEDLMNKIDEFFKVRKTTASATCITSSSEILPPASSLSNLSHHLNPTSSSTTEATPSPQNHNYSSLKTSCQSPVKKSPFSPPPPSSAPSSAQNKVVERRDQEEGQNKGGGGKRWPREEVLALINLKCQISKADEISKECAGSKIPLWERISKGMKELGYSRSAKRCKEKWENINKYFRKTKDSKKKRSLESRTCPYFHQLNTLYTQGTLPMLPAPSDVQPPDQTR